MEGTAGVDSGQKRGRTSPMREDVEVPIGKQGHVTMRDTPSEDRKEPTSRGWLCVERRWLQTWRDYRYMGATTLPPFEVVLRAKAGKQAEC